VNRALPALLLAGAAAAAGCASPPAPRRAELLQEADRQFLAGQFGPAAANYEAYLAENPGEARRAEIEGRMGRCHLAQGRPDAAIRAFDRALATSPPAEARWSIAFRRAVALRMQGDLPRALEGFRAVAAAPPDERGRAVVADELYFEHATALFRAGQWKAGQEELSRVSPRGPFAARARLCRALTAFTVQIGAFHEEPQAAAQAEKARARVLPVPARAPGDAPLFVVTSGSFARYDDAQREADRLRKSGYPDAFVIP
jgi:tetratricopeptide (TPR) repeat protein